MKVYGYIVPPTRITEFAVTVYASNDYFYIAEISNEIIIQFFQLGDAHGMLESGVTIQKIDANEIKIIGDKPWYCYLGPNESNNLFGEKETINEMLEQLLVGNEINNFAKLSIANFLQLVGKREKIIRDILNEYRTLNIQFEFGTTLENSVKIEDEKIPVIFDDINLFTQQNKYLEFDDYFSISYDAIFFKDYQCPLKTFIANVREHEIILDSYILCKSAEERETIKLENKTIFSMHLNDRLNHTFSYNELQQTENEMGILYQMEQGMASQLEVISDTLDILEASLLEKLKKIKPTRLINYEPAQ